MLSDIKTIISFFAYAFMYIIMIQNITGVTYFLAIVYRIINFPEN